MKTQILFFHFNTKTKDGSVIATGVRVESQVITKDMLNAELPVFCGTSLFDNGVPTEVIAALKHSAATNL
jgi:hypothetical protein